MTNNLTLVQPPAEGYTTVELDVARDQAAIRNIDEWAFAFAPPEGEDPLAFEPEPGRSVGVRYGDELVAVHSSFESTLTVPGGRIPAAGLTWVGVHPGHRRRGLARAMLTTHLRQTAQRREPVSVLFAAEPEIYGRYGYGLAALNQSATLPRGAALRDVPGSRDLTCSLERADRDQHADVVLDLMQRTTRPGLLVPHRRPHLDNVFAEHAQWRKDAEMRRIAVVRSASGDTRAFATFRRTLDWDGVNPAGKVAVGLWTALDGAAEHRLFSTLLDFDLMGKVTIPHVASDSPLLTQLINIRSADLRTWDNLWLRIVDLPAALAARSYQAPVDVVLEVSDDLLPENAGRWRIQASSDGAQVTRAAEEDPALTIGIADLGALYLGGGQLSALVAAGLVDVADPDGARSLSVALGGDLQPLCGWDF